MAEPSFAKSSTEMTAGEEVLTNSALFLDTSLIVAATVAVHPAHGVATAFIDEAIAQEHDLCISHQVCREFLVVLTRQPVSDRVFELDEALGALEVWTTGCRVLEETEAVLGNLLALIRQFGVRGKQVHDCNIVATMLANGISRLATRNAQDFQRYSTLIQIEAV